MIGRDEGATSELATVGAAVRVEPMEFSEAQRQLIRDSFANGASDAEFAVLMEIARARRLNPLLKQIHFVQRWDSDKHRMVWAAQVSIDGLRALAERTQLYQGQDEPEFVENDDGTLKLCKVRVWRKDWPRPAVGVAYWSEYVQTTRDRQTGKTRPSASWARMPHVMLAKVAEALALRKAFPEDMSGLYASEEMGHLQPSREAPQPARVVALQPAPAASHTEVHIHAALPPVTPDRGRDAPVVAATVEPEAPSSRPAPEPKRVDPWLDYYG